MRREAFVNVLAAYLVGVGISLLLIAAAAGLHEKVFKRIFPR